MAVTDFVRRSMQIVAGGIVQSTTDYFDNAVSFASDVKEVIDMGKQAGSSGVEKFNELRHSGIIKKARDWFYNEGGMFGDFDFDDEEFDAGFEIDSVDNTSSEDSKPLSKDMMTDIAKKQTGAMYKAFGRQADLQIANTAEIISTLNTRSAELTASVNNVNNTLIQIGKRLDLIVEWTSTRAKKEEEEKRTSSIFDYGGGISLTGVVNKFKENAEDSMVGTLLSLGQTLLGSGMMTPEMVMSMVLSQTILEKKFTGLGNKSINDIGNFLNDTIGEVVQNAMTAVLTTKNEWLSEIFSDVIGNGANKNYQSYVKNTYNEKPAVFDGITRKSIISVIPGYLKEILVAVGGRSLSVNEKGDLTAKKNDSFVSKVSSNYFRYGTLEYEDTERMSNKMPLSTSEISKAARCLTGAWVYYMTYKSSRKLLRIGEVSDPTAASTSYVIDLAAEMLSSRRDSSYSKAEWVIHLQMISQNLDEFKYRQQIQDSVERAHKDLVQGAKTDPNASTYRAVNETLLKQAFNEAWNDYRTTTTNSSNTGNNGVNPSQIGTGNALTVTTTDYLATILNRLNTGINVFITGSKTKKPQKAPYTPIRVTPGISRSNIISTINTTSDNTVTSAPNIISSAADVVSGGNTANDKYKDAPEEIQIIAQRQELGLASEEEIQQLEKYNKKHNKEKSGNWFKSGISKLKNWWEGFANESRREYLLPPGSGEFQEFLNKIIPQKAKDQYNEFKNSDTVQNMINSETGQKIKNNATKAKNKVNDILQGDVVDTVVNEDGTTTVTREGGILHNIAKPTSNVINSINTGIDSNSGRFTSKKKLESRVDKLANDFRNIPEGKENDRDLLAMQQLATMIDIAKEGGYDNLDTQEITKIINTIEDKTLQQRLKRSIVPLMKRNSKGSDKSNTGGSEKKGTGLLGLFGNVGKLVMSAASMLLGPIKLYIGVIGKSILGIVKYGFGTIAKIVMRGVKSGFVQMNAGLKSFGSGFKMMTQPLLKTITKTSSWVVKKATTGIELMKNGLSKGLKFIGGKLSGLFGGMWDGVKNLFGKSSGSKKSNSFLDKLGNTSIGRGFGSAMKEYREAQVKAKLKEEAAPITEGMNQSEVSRALNEAGGKHKNWFKGILECLTGIFKNTEKDDNKHNDGSMQDIDGAEASSDLGGNNTNNGESPQMDDISAPTSNTNNNSQMQDINTTSASTDLGGNQGSSGGVQMEGVSSGGGSPLSRAGSAIGGVKDKIGEGLGKMLGGLTNILMGGLKMLISIVAGMEAVKALSKFVTELLKSSLQPLNKAFQALTKALKPLLKQVGGLIKQIAEAIVGIVDIVLDTIKPILEDVVKPILELLSPLLDSILGVLTPILSLVGSLIKVIMVPILGIFKYVVVPIIRLISDTLQVIMGIVQIVGGALMMLGGGIISVLGTILGTIGKLFGGGDLGSSILDTGTKMMSQGTDFMTQGAKSVVKGAASYVLDLASFYTLGAIPNSDEVFGDKAEEKPKQEIKTPEGDVISNTYANGDTTTNIYNTYGGEYQRGMGGYLNMDQRGCGPIALADMYNRRGGNLSARSLAGSMYGAGIYNPNRGTSVGGYIDTARSLGMNLRAGNVTQQSLKSASPTNPITVIGSGSDYGTRRGNNHFMNVIGTDRHGGAYVSNPLTGRVDRRPASTIAGTSVMGLYGSGDVADGGWTFPEAVQEAFKQLKTQASKILGLFTMEKEETVDDMLNEEQNKAALDQAKRELGDDFSQYEAEAKRLAMQDYVKINPKKDGQSDEEYQAAFEKWYSTRSSTYLAKTKVLDAATQQGKDAWTTLATTADGTANGYNDLLDELSTGVKKAGESIQNMSPYGSNGGSNGSGGPGYFTSDEGVALWTPYADNIEISDTNILGDDDYHAPLFEFFAKTMGYNLGGVKGSGWFSKYNNPNSEGVGQSGSGHSGVDFTGGGILGKPLYATTSGEVVVNTFQAGGAGNYLVWKDSAGKYHWYMHMNEPSDVPVGQKINGGDLIGYVGSTGHSTGPHLHYTINTDLSGSGNGKVYNPLLYFRNFNPNAASGGGLIGSDNQEKIWNYLRYYGLSPEQAAGIMGNIGQESNFESNNVQNEYEYKVGTDTEYTNKVNDKSYSRNQFTNDSAGYGLAQWTDPGRKGNLYDTLIGNNIPIDDMLSQLDFLRGEYPNTWSGLQGVTGINEATLFWEKNFEGASQPEMQHRYDIANQIFTRFQNNPVPTSLSNLTSANTLNTADPTYTKYGTGIITTQSDALNIRDDNSMNGNIIGKIPKGATVRIIGDDYNNWWKVSYQGIEGWVNKSYVTLNNDGTYTPNYEGGHIPGRDNEKLFTDPNGNKKYQGAYPPSQYNSNIPNVVRYPDGSFDILSDINNTPEVHLGDYNYPGKGGDGRYDNTTELDKKKFKTDDPRWRAAWYDEMYPTHYTEDATAYHILDDLTVAMKGNKTLEANLYKEAGNIDILDPFIKELGNSSGTGWRNLRDEYVLKISPQSGKRKNSRFVEALNMLHNTYYPYDPLTYAETNTRIAGSGDADLDFWNSYMNWNNNSNVNIPTSTQYAPYDSSMYYDEATGTTVVNNYAIRRGDDTVNDERVKAILANTYNVRSESMEQLLYAILEELKRRKKGSDGGGSTNTPKLFDERIPAQVSRLSIG